VKEPREYPLALGLSLLVNSRPRLRRQGQTELAPRLFDDMVAQIGDGFVGQQSASLDGYEKGERPHASESVHSSLRVVRGPGVQ